MGEQWHKGVPIEVIPMAYVPLMKRIATQLNGKPTLRMSGPSKAGPVVTDNGNFILDVDFGVISKPKELDQKLKALVGVVETGLFVNMVEKAFFGQKDGTVIEVERNGKRKQK